MKVVYTTKRLLHKSTGLSAIIVASSCSARVDQRNLGITNRDVVHSGLKCSPLVYFNKPVSRAQLTNIYCSGNPPEWPINPECKLKLEPKKQPDGLDMEIQPFNNDMNKLLEEMTRTVVLERNGKLYQGAETDTLQLAVSIVLLRGRKRKHRKRVSQRKRRKRPHLTQTSVASAAKTPPKRWGLRLTSDMSARTGDSTFCFNADWNRLAAALNPRAQYMADV